MVFFMVLALTAFGMRDGIAQSKTGRKDVHPKRVLILYSEGRDTPGNISMQQAFQMELEKLSTAKIDFFEEQLDTGHFTDKEHFKIFKDYLGKKYTQKDLDLIMVFPSGNYTLAGALPDALFPEVPVVFASVNDLEVPYDIGKLGVTGIIQRNDVRGTLGLILRLQPETHEVVVIGGKSEMDGKSLSRVIKTAQGLEGVQFKFWTNQPMAELLTTVKLLLPGTTILLSSFHRDASGEPYSTAQVAQMLAPLASVPIYVMNGMAVGSGAVGGVVADSQTLGERTGQLAYKVMRGIKPESVPMEVETKGTPMVDWRALQHWRISDNRTPGNCLVRYRPNTLWGMHRNLIVFILAIFLMQTTTIVGLLAQRRRRHEAEREVLEQRMELAHVTRVSTLGQLTAMLAHELGHPLGAILRNTEEAEIFLKKEPPELEEIRAILEDIRKDDQRASRVIDRLRSLLKRRSLELKTLDLGELLNEAVTLTKPDARTREVNLILNLPPKLPPVYGDRIHLQQVLLNLILNGMEAMAEIEKHERQFTINVEIKKNGHIEVGVRDCGQGIPPDKLKQLFRPFFTTKPGGMGMGLAIAKTIIDAHGGTIGGENNVPRGAVFKFTLPPRPSNL